MLKCFHTKSRGIHNGSVPMFLVESNEVRVTQDDSPQAMDRLSKRLAMHTMKLTEWDLVAGGVFLEITGDSLLIISWLCGQWKAEGHHYQQRVNKIINTLDGMSSMYGVRPAEAGRDLLKHEYREWNEKANVLTRQAREGRQFQTEYLSLLPHEMSLCEPCLIRAGFDGGACRLGAGCGAWIQIGLRSRYHNLWDSSGYSNTPPPQIIYKEVLATAFLLEDGSTVTDTELSAVECVIDVLPRVLYAFFRDRLIDM